MPAYNRSVQPVGILYRRVCMIPECSSLVINAELVSKALQRRDGTLGNSRDSIHPCCVVLIDAVPVNAGAGIRHVIVDDNLHNEV